MTFFIKAQAWASVTIDVEREFDPEDFLWCDTEDEVMAEITTRLESQSWDAGAAYNGQGSSSVDDVEDIQVNVDDYNAFIERWKELKGNESDE